MNAVTTSDLSWQDAHEVNIAVVTLRQRHKQSPIEGVVLHIVAMAADYADHEQIVRRVIFRRLSVTNVLTDCFRIRENLLRHPIVNNRDARRIFVFGFGLGEIAATQELYTDRIEITWGRRSVERARAGSGAFGSVGSASRSDMIRRLLVKLP